MVGNIGVTGNSYQHSTEIFREAKGNLLQLLFSEKLYKTLFATMDAMKQIPSTHSPEESAQGKLHSDLMDKFFREKGLEVCCENLRKEINLIKDAIHKHNACLRTNIPLQPYEEIGGHFYDRN